MIHSRTIPPQLKSLKRAHRFMAVIVCEICGVENEVFVNARSTPRPFYTFDELAPSVSCMIMIINAAGRMSGLLRK